MSNVDSATPVTETRRLPSWLKRPVAYTGHHHTVLDEIHRNGLHTVCQEAKCPNRGECFARGTATFLILGDRCTRHCAFCSINHCPPEALDPCEPQKLTLAVKKLKLRHVVITSVTRDDLHDGGASVFAEVVKQLRHELPHIIIELLIPDLQGKTDALDQVFRSRPDILNHNIETVPSLYPLIRPEAIYTRSLELLRYASSKNLVTKSGIMVGLGETGSELISVMHDLKTHGCRILTIGQYLQPSPKQVSVKQFVTPEMFDYYRDEAQRIGFEAVYSGPFVRSSYRADEFLINKYAVSSILKKGMVLL